MTLTPAASPRAAAPAPDGVLPRAVRDLLLGTSYVVLTGAGLSTDSGIPDYRGPGAPVRAPMTFSEFRSGDAARRRYWARGYVGWSRMGHASPNDGHHALARLERTTSLRLLVTQNVDGLHERAGSRAVLALHGRIRDVVCLGCGDRTGRSHLQQRMGADNPGWLSRHGHAVQRPDGDVELDDVEGFAVPACHGCGGVLKPDVVFFGENVPPARVTRAREAVEQAGALLVVGSSLTVMSGFRFVRQAAKQGAPVIIVNRGATRGDDLATHRVETGCSEFLTALAAAAESR